MKKTSEKDDISGDSTTTLLQYALHECTRINRHQLDLNTYFKEIHDLVASLMYAENFYIAVIDEKSNIASIPYFCDTVDVLDFHEFDSPLVSDFDRGITSYMFKRTEIVDLTEKELLELQQKGEIDIIGMVPKQWVGVQFFRQNKVIGGMVVQNYSTGQVYSSDEKDLLVLISQQIASNLSWQLNETKLLHKIKELEQTQVQLIQSEKMASVGSLAAGIAHEINNPVGYISSNFRSLKDYVKHLSELVQLYLKLESNIKSGNSDHSSIQNELARLHNEEDIQDLLQDINDLISESSEGLDKVKDIVESLKSFSHIDSKEKKETDINDCIEQTLKIVRNDLKYNCEIIKSLKQVPKIKCYPGQINQVLVNILVNAGHAIKEHGTIQIATDFKDNNIICEISDSGTGIEEKLLGQIFTPFFTTKPIGKGTGLGLSISYGIIERHGGCISVESELGVGTKFTITLPLDHAVI